MSGGIQPVPEGEVRGRSSCVGLEGEAYCLPRDFGAPHAHFPACCCGPWSQQERSQQVCSPARLQCVGRTSPTVRLTKVSKAGRAWVECRVGTECRVWRGIQTVVVEVKASRSVLS